MHKCLIGKGLGMPPGKESLIDNALPEVSRLVGAC
jgi:hypothetical protein